MNSKEAWATKASLQYIVSPCLKKSNKTAKEQKMLSCTAVKSLNTNNKEKIFKMPREN